MHLYMSGTPRNDPYQTVENRLCTHRLFSMHAEYEKPVLKWVQQIRDGIMDADGFLEKFPHFLENMSARDVVRREAQKNYGHTADWDTADVLQNVCKTLDGRPYPKFIMLDSGAFTAWNKGEETTVDDVKRKYNAFLEIAKDDLFDEIWGINLDVIPGSKGVDPTPDELKRAVEVSDINFEILVKEFGDIILPVFHQGESWERLDECAAQVAGKSNYICVSPRNDLAETLRVKWSRDCHGILNKKHPDIMTHGLATTGNTMVRNVPWYSGDSAAWVQHGGFGMIDIFVTPEASGGGGRKPPHYMNYFVTMEGVYLDPFGQIKLKDGTQIGLAELGHDMDEYTRWDEEEGEYAATGKIFPIGDFLDKIDDVDELPWVGGHVDDEGKHYLKVTSAMRKYIRGRVEAYGFPFESTKWDSRIRNLICMAEIDAFSKWANAAPKVRPQLELF